MNFDTTYDKDSKIWSGPQKKQVFSECASIGEVVLYAMRIKNSQEICQINDDDGITLTYGCALNTAICIAQHLKSINIGADDVVGIFAPQTTYVMPVAVASWFNGTPFQSVNFALEQKVVKHLFDITQPKIIFCDGSRYEELKTATESYNPAIYTLRNHINGIPKIEDLLQATNTEMLYQAVPLKHGPDQTMIIFSSSGTTGLPKCVCFSNRLCITNLSFSNGSSTVFSFAGLDWGSGILALLANLLRGSRRIITSKPFEPELLLTIIIKYNINMFTSCPSHLLQLSLLPSFTKEAMKSVRVIMMTGSPCTVSTQKHVRSKLINGILMIVYGATEAGGGIAYNAADYKSNSVGKLVPSLEIKIVDHSTGKRLGPNQTGEICSRTNTKWQGYYGNPTATKEIIDSEGFIKTGDLGYMDDEHFLHLVDRCKDIMKFESWHYSPQEIEQLVSQIDDILDVCVFGVYEEKRNDVPAAAVVLREGSSLTAKDIMEYVASKTEARYKRIHYGVFMMNEIPRNNNGKVLRQKVKEMCLKMEKLQ